MSRLRDPKTLGFLVLTGWSAHAACHLAKGTGLSLLWCCNVGTLALALGLLVARPALAGAGLLMVAIGTPAWLAGLLLGELWMPTSLFTHFGALAAGLLAGAAALPKDTWRVGFAGLFALHLASHLVLPEGRDINLTEQAFGPEPFGHWVFTGVAGLLLLILLPRFERGLRSASQPLARATANSAAATASPAGRTPST